MNIFVYIHMNISIIYYHDFTIHITEKRENTVILQVQERSTKNFEILRATDKVL